MATFIEYELEDGTIILIEADEPPQSGLVQASRDKDGNVIKKAAKKFGDAFAGVKASVAAFRQELDELSVDEVEVTFGVKIAGELGNMAIGKVGTEANYQVTLKWSNATAE